MSGKLLLISFLIIIPIYIHWIVKFFKARKIIGDNLIENQKDFEATIVEVRVQLYVDSVYVKHITETDLPLVFKQYCIDSVSQDAQLLIEGYEIEIDGKKIQLIP